MNDIDSLLAAYVDGELDANTAREIEAIMAVNPAARRQCDMHRETASMLRAACAETVYMDGVDKLLKPQEKSIAQWRYGWAIAASLLIGMMGFGGGATWATWSGAERAHMMDEVAEYHEVYSRETVHLVEVPASQTDHLKSWLEKRVERKLEIPDLSSSGLHFAGARLVVLERMPVAALMYTRDTGLPVALCIMQKPGTPIGVRLDRRGPIQLASWEDGTHAYIVVGEMDHNAMRNVAARVMEQL